MARSPSTKLSFANRMSLLGEQRGGWAAGVNLARLFGPRASAEPPRAATDGQEPRQRGSEMVRQDRPEPILKPSPEMAHSIDAALFNARWAEERRLALIAELKARKSELKTLKASWQQAKADVAAAEDHGHSDDASRALFKSFRRAQMQHDPAMQRSGESMTRARHFLSR